MIVIVEGMDNAGKTTLCQYLAKQLKAVYVKVERPNRAIDLLQYQSLLEVANRYSGFVVTDRHVAISEPIYGPICRGGHDLKQEDIDLCVMRFQAIVYCRPPIESIMATLADRGQMQGVKENTERLVEAYDAWWSNVVDRRERMSGPTPFISAYNFTADPNGHVREHLMNSLKEQKEVCGL